MFERKSNHLGENITKNYKTFTVPITKELKRIVKKGEEITKLCKIYGKVIIKSC